MITTQMGNMKTGVMLQKSGISVREGGRCMCFRGQSDGGLIGTGKAVIS
jgi:hypothetical protein